MARDGSAVANLLEAAKPRTIIPLPSPGPMRTHDGYPSPKDAQGRNMTEYSITVTNPKLNKGQPTNIPSLWEGKVVDEDDAVERVLKSGRKYPAYSSIKEAEDAAKARSNKGGANAGRNFKTILED